MLRPSRVARSIAVACLALAFVPRGWTDDNPWVDLTGLDSWKSPTAGWSTVGSAGLDPSKPKALAVEPGSGVIYNGAAGRAPNLISKESFGDVELHVEFNIPKGSNSGVKFHSVYEIQIIDSFGKASLKGSDCGGIYPRSEMLPKYRYLDDGHAPLVNACKAPGEWQVLDLTFRAPRFDASGAKVASARIGAVLNGQVIHDDREVATPTGSNWDKPEKPSGPILLQGDHGPVAFRNLKARRLPARP